MAGAALPRAASKPACSQRQEEAEETIEWFCWVFSEEKYIHWYSVSGGKLNSSKLQSGEVRKVVGVSWAAFPTRALCLYPPRAGSRTSPLNSH